MRLANSLAPALLVLAACADAAKSAGWGFEAATVSVRSSKKSSEGGGGVKEKLSAQTPLAKPLALSSSETISVQLTTTENGSPKRAHQVFLLVQEPQTGLEAPFALKVKESGRSSVELAQKDLPIQLLVADTPLRASLVIGSFGEAPAVHSPVFEISVQQDPDAPKPTYDAPLRYGKRAEIAHTFRDDPRSPPKVISLFFVAVVLAALPALFIGWLALGANLNHVQKALGDAPLSHATFFGSLVAMEGVFFMYYTSWNLFQTLPAIGLVAAVAFFSGSRALGEVQSRRLAGAR